MFRELLEKYFSYGRFHVQALEQYVSLLPLLAFWYELAIISELKYRKTQYLNILSVCHTPWENTQDIVLLEVHKSNRIQD